MENIKNTKNIKLIISIIGIVCLLIGVSYATYSFILQGNREHQVNIGSLILQYEETNNINITSDSVKTDEEGINSTNSFNFSVSVNNTTNKNIDYNVYLTVYSEYIDNVSFAKVYLENTTLNMTYGPSKISDLAKYKYDNSYFLCSSGFSNTTETHNYVLKSWIADKKTVIDSGTTHQTTLGSSIKFKISVETISDTSGASVPVLASNMIPVYYDGTTWRKADSTNSNWNYKWYNYTNKMWANAVTVTETSRSTYLSAELGTEISMDDINTMWVWIPRFSAVTPSNYNGGTKEAPGAIDVTFVDNETSAHDAFTFGTKNLSGFWYAKFETSHTTLASNIKKNNLGCTTETCSNANGIIIKPNVTSLGYNNVSNFFYASRSMEQSSNSFGFVSSEVDTHMSKNNEWGAVAYLTQSIYGRCTSSTSCTEVGINNNSSYITGYGAPAGSDDTITNGAYNTDLGKDASTTGNIYGIYDMSGGPYEYVMGVYTDGTQNWSGYNETKNSGFTGMLNDGTTYSGVAYPESKYYNSYTNTGDSVSPVTNYTNDMQHALIETKGWYSDSANFVRSNSPWFMRGGYCSGSSSAGVFYFNYYNGNAHSFNSVRLVITNE